MNKEQETEEIHHFKDGSFLILTYDNDNDFCKRFEKHGYHKKPGILEPYFHVNHECIFIEMNWLTNGTMHILDLWNGYECIMIFYAKNNAEALELFSKLVDIAEKMVNIEYKLMLMNENRVPPKLGDE